MELLRAQAVEHGEADIGAVFGPKRALAEGRVDDLDDFVGHAARFGVVGTIAAIAFNALHRSPGRG
jgi:hypothetical protein